MVNYGELRLPLKFQKYLSMLGVSSGRDFNFKILLLKSFDTSKKLWCENNL